MDCYWQFNYYKEIWFSNKINQEFFQDVIESVLWYSCMTRTPAEKARGELHMFCSNASSGISRSSSCMVSYLPSHKPSKKDEEDMPGTTKGVGTHS